MEWINVDEPPEPSGARCWQGMALSETVLMVVKHPGTHKPWVRFGRFAHDVDFDGVYVEGLYDLYPATIVTAGATLWMPIPELPDSNEETPEKVAQLQSILDLWDGNPALPEPPEVA